MPYKNPKRDRNYKRENENYASKPEQIANRVARNKARREAIRKGLVSVGDGKDIDHITPLSKGGTNTTNNTRIVDAGDNRSFDRNADHSVKKNTPMKGRKK